MSVESKLGFEYILCARKGQHDDGPRCKTGRSAEPADVADPTPKHLCTNTSRLRPTAPHRNLDYQCTIRSCRKPRAYGEYSRVG